MSNTVIGNNENKAVKREKGQPVLTAIGLLLCAILLPILVINVTLIVKSYVNENEVPNVGGVFPLIVLTDSMYPEIESGDLIICQTVDEDDIRVGDVISFFDPDGNGTSIVTHRVMSITQNENGEPAFVTKGDLNNTEDKTPASNIVGRYVRRVPNVGRAAMFMQTTTGLIVCVVLPFVLLVGVDLLRNAKYAKAREKDTSELLRELEELRAKQSSGEKQ